jgi:hypothetical protein
LIASIVVFIAVILTVTRGERQRLQLMNPLIFAGLERA